MPHIPDEIGRNEFDEWCWRRGLSLREIVEGLGQAAIRLRHDDGRDRSRAVPSIETVRRVRLPFTDQGRRTPTGDLVELIHAYTDGVIVAAHFYPPTVRGAPQVAADARS